MMELEGVDLSNVFNPDTSAALHIIQVRGAGKGNKFKDFLLNENCSIETLEQCMHGGRLLHIQKNGSTAYAQTTKITTDNTPQLQRSASVNPDDNHLWNIEVAFLDGTTPLLIAVERALMEMKNHHRIDSMFCLEVGLYQRISKLIQYAHDQHREENIRIQTIGYHKNQIELQSKRSIKLIFSMTC